MLPTCKGVCTICKFIVNNTYRKLKCILDKQSGIWNYGFTTNIKITKNLTTNVLIFIYLFLFFYSPNLLPSYVVLCLIGSNIKTQRMMVGGGSHGKAWHIWCEISFFFPYYILSAYGVVFFSCASSYRSFSFLFLDKKKEKGRIYRRVRELRQGLTHLEWELLKRI